MSNYYRAQAIYATHSNAKYGDGTNYYDANDNVISLDETKIATKQEEIENLEAIRMLREERDKRLSEVDWWTIKSNDTGVSLTQEQKDYKQALRDLPSTASPTLVNGELSNVTWPTKPE